MYNSGITTREFIDSLKNEIDVSMPIADASFLRAINTAEQFLYTEILKEYVATTIDYEEIEDNTISESDLASISGVEKPIFDDIIKVFADKDELERAGVVGVLDFPEKNLYYNRYDGNISISTDYTPDKITVVYRIRPQIKTNTNVETTYIAVPVEFVELIAAKVRGEMYKLMNEDALSAKWLSDYNSNLENFKVWAMSRNERFGG